MGLLSSYEKVLPLEDDDEDGTFGVENAENTEPETEHRMADIEVRGMSKVWESTGQMAVNTLSFRAYRGKVNEKIEDTKCDFWNGFSQDILQMPNGMIA